MKQINAYSQFLHRINAFRAIPKHVGVGLLFNIQASKKRRDWTLCVFIYLGVAITTLWKQYSKLTEFVKLLPIQSV